MEISVITHRNSHCDFLVCVCVQSEVCGRQQEAGRLPNRENQAIHLWVDLRTKRSNFDLPTSISP